VKTLRTPRLLLREVAPGDVEDVHAYAGDPEVCVHVQWGPNTPEESRAWVEQEVAATADPHRRERTWMVVLADRVVGACSVTVTDAQHRRAETGYVVAREFWGRGIATEAAGAVLRWAFDELGVDRVEATCRPENVASARVLATIGMQQEGYLRSHLLIRGERRDSLLFAALRPASAQDRVLEP
jgi:ribosomal-protein-alanine N-acetyltransferase